MAFTAITITGTFVRPDGLPDQGTITATLSEPMTNSGETVEVEPILGMLNSEGELVAQSGEPFELFANDDVGTKPPGAEYAFVLQLDNAPVRAFSAAVPHAAAEGKIDLIELEA